MLLTVLPGLAVVNANEPQDWEIVINIPEYKLYLYQGSELYQSFPIAVGKPSTPSPVGDFWVASKVVNPTWSPFGKKPVPPGPKNPLGKYWLGLNINGYGIHGNNAASSIGNPVSKGCFRMNNEDIKSLFQLIPKGTPVRITYTPLVGRVDSEQRAWLEIYQDIYKRVNLDIEVQRILSDLQWAYQPHLGALFQLVKAELKGFIEIPRMVHLTGDLSGDDAFFWNNRIYLARSYFSDVNEISTVPENELFIHYIDLETLRLTLGESFNYSWTNDIGMLAFFKPKLLINGVELKQTVRYIQSEPYLDLKKVSEKTDSYVNYNYLKGQVDRGEIQIYTDPNDSVLWIYVNDLTQILNNITVIFDKARMTFEITTDG